MANNLMTDIVKELTELRKILEDLKAQAGETDSILCTTFFPLEPYNNQLVIRTDLTPPDGGQLYRFNDTIGEWLQIT